VVTGNFGEEMMKCQTLFQEARRSCLFRHYPTLFLLLVAICPSLCSTQAFAGSRITSFAIPGAVFVEVIGIDSAGSVAGFYQDSNSVFHGFRRDATGKIAKFDAPGAGVGANQGTEFEAMSPGGYLCGLYITSNSVEYGFLLSPSGEFSQIDIPGSSYTFASGVNDAGQVVGAYSSSSGSYGFLWTNSGVLVTFQPVAGGNVAWARINAFGDIAGLYWASLASSDRGYYRSAAGDFATFVGSPTEISVDGVEINDVSTLVGEFTAYMNGITTHGFMREGTTITQIDVPGAARTSMTDVNNSGTGAGYYQDTLGVFHSFLRDELGNFTYFDDPNAGHKADQGTFAIAINATGEVAGTYIDQSGNQDRGFVRK
jgi:hypothetical protein